MRRRRRALIRRAVLLVVVAAVTPVLYSYVNMALQPSSLPLGVRSVDWVRGHGGGWLVNAVEQRYYKLKQAKPGGPGLTTLPVAGTLAAPKPVHAAPAYRPPTLRSVFRPALPGEGVWHAVTPSFHGAPPLLVTTFRSDPEFPRVVAYVAWLDHTRTQLGLYPGRYDPPASAAARGPMQVPYGERWRLLASFNSGFAYRDVHSGFVINGHVYGSLQPDKGTLLVDRRGRVDIVSWRGGPAPGADIVVARQNLPLIVNGGRANPNLTDSTTTWGATLGNAVRVWRSGVGIDSHGNLVYAAADYMTVRSLAAILIHAGAVRAIELDINPTWPTFITYTHGAQLAAAKLFPTSHPASRYLNPDDRDFFAVYRQVPGSTTVPLR
jgi:hypothetical protein